MKNNFSNGKLVHAYGEIKRGGMGLEIVHPDYKFYASEQKPDVEQSLTPFIQPPMGYAKSLCVT